MCFTSFCSMRITRDVFFGTRLIDHVEVVSLYSNHSVFGLSCLSGDLPLNTAAVCDDGPSLLGVISAGSSSFLGLFFSFFVVLTSLGGLVGVETGLVRVLSLISSVCCNEAVDFVMVMR